MCKKEKRVHQDIDFIIKHLKTFYSCFKELVWLFWLFAETIMEEQAGCHKCLLGIVLPVMYWSDLLKISLFSIFIFLHHSMGCRAGLSPCRQGNFPQASYIFCCAHKCMFSCNEHSLLPPSSWFSVQEKQVIKETFGGLCLIRESKQLACLAQAEFLVMGNGGCYALLITDAAHLY